MRSLDFLNALNDTKDEYVVSSAPGVRPGASRKGIRIALIARLPR